jgi:SSS family solute:Na+ symporter
VVWTDALQLLLVLGGVAASVAFVVSSLPGGLGDVAAALTAPGREPVLRLDADVNAYPGFWTGLLAYGVLALSVAGTNQQSVQRYLACADLRAARRAALLSWAVGAVVVLLTLGLGVALFALHGDAGEGPWHGVKADAVFATFVAEGLPVGLAGLLAAAVFAASMSSIDSAIHAMATATLVDFVERIRTRPLGEAARLRTARALTLVYGTLAVGAAFYAMTRGRDTIDLLLRWMGFLAGPVLGLFLLGRFTRRVRSAHALSGFAAGYAAVLLGFLLPLGGGGRTWAAGQGIHWIWAAALACLLTVLVAWLAARLTPARGDPTPP